MKLLRNISPNDFFQTIKNYCWCKGDRKIVDNRTEPQVTRDFAGGRQYILCNVELEQFTRKLFLFSVSEDNNGLKK